MKKIIVMTAMLGLITSGLLAKDVITIYQLGGIGVSFSERKAYIEEIKKKYATGRRCATDNDIKTTEAVNTCLKYASLPFKQAKAKALKVRGETEKSDEVIEEFMQEADAQEEMIVNCTKTLNNVLWSDINGCIDEGMRRMQ